MRVVFITRSTLFAVPGGDTVQIAQTVRHLNRLGVSADICPTHSGINYGDYDLLHFTNITRPADILFHVRRSGKPYVLSPVLIDYSEYDRQHRKGFSGALLRLVPASQVEYLKSIGRWLKGGDVLQTKSYLWKGHRRSVQEILHGAAMVLPNSAAEARSLQEAYQVKSPLSVVPAGIDNVLFQPSGESGRDKKLVICAARMEGIKNQLNLIRALNDTEYRLLLIGAAAPNQTAYYEECRRNAAGNVEFRDRISQEELVSYYRKAGVHALPSWFETCGLSSLEAAAMGCAITITDKGYTRDYFGDSAYYCEPADPRSIREAVDRAAEKGPCPDLQQKIFSQYTWQEAARKTADAYRQIVKT